MAKSKNRWDVIYGTVDEQAHKTIPHFAAQNVDYKTALTVKRNHKRIVAMEIKPTLKSDDARCSCKYPVSIYENSILICKVCKKQC